jgi:5-methylcytosine-specific restriction endonuclease McrA
MGTPACAEWQADHVIPLIEGGAFGIENARTLCLPHHKAETRALAQRRASARKGA